MIEKIEGIGPAKAKLLLSAMSYHQLLATYRARYLGHRVHYVQCCRVMRYQSTAMCAPHLAIHVETHLVEAVTLSPPPRLVGNTWQIRTQRNHPSLMFVPRLHTQNRLSCTNGLSTAIGCFFCFSFLGFASGYRGSGLSTFTSHTFSASSTLMPSSS